MENKLIKIVFNGFGEDIPENTTIAQLIDHKNEIDGGLIVERNNKYIFRHDYEKTVIADGDKIEFINPDFGG
jgi:thiamine biosynthesis protein ThiS